MNHPNKLRETVQSGRADVNLQQLYGARPARLEYQRRRYSRLLDEYHSLFPSSKQVELFSVPGRTEVGGNHTDHNAGHVLAAAVDLDALAAAAKNGTPVITLHSEGYPPAVVDTRQLNPVPDEKTTSGALIRGVCARLTQLGLRVGGFDACVTSDVLKGSGISSSAAFEVLVCTILDHLYNHGDLDPILAARIGQFAENEYFGKPCGLMDQTTCALGGFVTIDFEDLSSPLVHKVDFDFSASRYALVIVDTGGNHADLTREYAAVADEMKSVARALGGQVLRQVTRRQVLEQMASLRARVNDRAILRALHFFDEDQRVLDEVTALKQNDFPRFLELVIASGVSSWMLNQNCYDPKAPAEQGIPLALEASRRLLEGRGAWRVHGGGFAGTIQAFVPDDMLDMYMENLGGVFGENACHVMRVRPLGAIRLELA